MPPRLTLAVRAGSRFAPRLGVLLLMMVATARAGEPGTISWRTDFERARAEAKALGRPLWLQFTGPWCGYCRKLERESFARADVVALARGRFVPVEVRPDVDEELSSRFNITGIPATVLLTPEGRVIARQEGYTDPATFLALLHQAAPTLVRASAEAQIGEGLALAGNCPVRLIQTGTLEPGRPGVATVHEGRRYRFADPAARAAFLRDPARYVPVEGGRCVVALADQGRQVPGDPARGVSYRGRLYLCADEPARARFAADPERYANPDVAHRGDCPHCLATTGDRVQGLPRYSASHAGRRYFFPAPDHLEAFRTAPETYLR